MQPGLRLSHCRVTGLSKTHLLPLEQTIFPTLTYFNLMTKCCHSFLSLSLLSYWVADVATT